MEWLLCQWALAMQEYSFQIVYCKGSLNANTDALSRSPIHSASQPVAMTSIQQLTIQLEDAQQSDPVCQQTHQTLMSSPYKKPQDSAWRQSPL